VPIPETKYKRSKNVFIVTFIVLNCAHICALLLQSLAQSLIGSPGTLAACVEAEGMEEFCATDNNSVTSNKRSMIAIAVSFIIALILAICGIIELSGPAPQLSRSLHEESLGTKGPERSIEWWRCRCKLPT